MNFEIKQRDRVRRRVALAGFATSLALLSIPVGSASATGGISTGGGTGTVAGDTAKLKRNGKAIPPENAPRRVKRAIRAGNEIDDKRYCLGGGHGGWYSRCYDCSGAVSYVLGRPGARVVSAPMPSGSYTNWGRRGKGKWITTYADSGHMFVVIAGLRFDTSMPDDGESGPGWSKSIRTGYRNVSRTAARHPARF